MLSLNIVVYFIVILGFWYLILSFGLVDLKRLYSGRKSLKSLGKEA